MKRPFYMIAEIERDSAGRVIPQRCVSGPYADYLLARQVSAVLGDDYAVFEYESLAGQEKAAKEES